MAQDSEDDEDFEQLYRDRRSWLRPRLMRLGAKTPEDEDVMQQAFENLLASGKPLSEIRSLKAYLIRVAGRVLSKARERELCRDHVIVDSDLMEKAAELAENGQIDDAAALREELGEIVAPLSESEREVFPMVVFGGFGAPEIARGIEQPLSRVERWVTGVYERLEVVKSQRHTGKRK